MNKSCFSVLAVLLTILTVSDASAGEAIYACAQKNSGDLRIVPAPGQCRNSEYEVTWTSGDQSQQRINELLGRVAALEGALGVINEAPVVDAGSDQTLLVSMVLYSDASVTDDGLMLPLTYYWEEAGGSGNVHFSSPDDLETSMQFAAPGTYAIRLSVNDGLVTITDDLELTVYPDNTPPTISFAQDSLVVPAKLTNNGRLRMECADIPLGALVVDDGLPLALSHEWTRTSVARQGGATYNFGTGAVVNEPTIDPADASLTMWIESTQPDCFAWACLARSISTRAVLAVNDGYFPAESYVDVSCDIAASAIPVVDAGPDETQTGTGFNSATGRYDCDFNLSGQAEDDGLPSPLVTSWAISSAYSPDSSYNWVYSAGFGDVNALQTQLSVNILPGASYYSPDEVWIKVVLNADDGYNRSATDVVQLICARPGA